MNNIALTYDDILIQPQYSDLTSRRDGNPQMDGYKLPVIMSPMDTITTPKMIKLFHGA